MPECFLWVIAALANDSNFLCLLQIAADAVLSIYSYEPLRLIHITHFEFYSF